MPPVDLRPPPLKVIMTPCEKVSGARHGLFEWSHPCHRLTMQQAAELVSRVWSVPCRDHRPGDDWSPDIHGECRNKVMLLRYYLGGKPILGQRTDRPGRELHCALAFKINDTMLVADFDGVHHLDKFPFRWVTPK